MSFLTKLRERDETKPERRKRLHGALRMGAYLLVPLTVCGGISIRNAKAEYTNTTLEFGKQMLQLANTKNHDVTTIKFNGQTMYLGSSSSLEDPKAALARYEDYCQKNPGQPGAGWDDFEKRAGKIDDADSVRGGTVMKMEDGDRGVVACFVKGSRMKATVEDAFEALFTTGDLGALGELRYAYASRGPSGQTLLLTAWTDSRFNIMDMMGDGKTDAPGEDFSEAPRVPHSVRMISARAEGTPYGINVYKTTDSPTKILAYYDAEMRGNGWLAYDPELKGEDGQGRGYLKDGVVITLASTEHKDGHFVSLGISGANADDRKVSDRQP